MKIGWNQALLPSGNKQLLDEAEHDIKNYSKVRPDTFSYPEPFLRAVNGARRGALAKSISNWHLIGYNEGYCSNTGYILLPCFHGIRLWIWPEPLVAPRVRRALGTRMGLILRLELFRQRSMLSAEAKLRWITLTEV